MQHATSATCNHLAKSMGKKKSSKKGKRRGNDNQQLQRNTTNDKQLIIMNETNDVMRRVRKDGTTVPYEYIVV
jgi:hypothetical protein